MDFSGARLPDAPMPLRAIQIAGLLVDLVRGRWLGGMGKGFSLEPPRFLFKGTPVCLLPFV